MSDPATSGFGKFVPGFDFLQNLAKGASQTIPQLPNLANWVSPSLNVEELEKRIAELRAVHFWLEQNSRALGATIQALEVQKMTLATLKGMNFNLGDVANAFKLKAADSVAAVLPEVSERAGGNGKTGSSAPTSVSGAPKTGAKPAKGSAGAKTADGAGAMVDPLQFWGSLTKQFQQIAAGALQDATRKTALDATRSMSAGLVKESVKADKKGSASRSKASSGRKPERRS